SPPSPWKTRTSGYSLFGSYALGTARAYARVVPATTSVSFVTVVTSPDAPASAAPPSGPDPLTGSSAQAATTTAITSGRVMLRMAGRSIAGRPARVRGRRQRRSRARARGPRGVAPGLHLR